MARQREFTGKIHDIHRARGRTPLAMVDTFGCQQNVADSQHILGMLRDMGCDFTDDPARADIVVMNTCAIRDHAEKRVYGTLGALTHTKKANPEQIICLCGCMAQRPEVARRVRESYRHVDLVFGPQALWKFPELLYRVYTRRGRVFSVENEHRSIAEGMPVVREGRVRAWVSIMYGCNNFCSYCIVPYVRGRERSRSPERIVEEVRQLAAEGYKEITLLGQNVNSYRFGEVDFPGLMRRVASVSPLLRVRFATSHPKDISDSLLEVMAEMPNICRAIHLPAQSGASSMLARMNRKYTREWYLDRVAAIRRYLPDCAVTTDLIAGFSGETEEEHAATLSLMREVGYEFAYMFKYSERPGTYAHKHLSDDVPEEVKSARLAEIIALQNELSRASNLRDVGREFEVLVEGTSKRDENQLSGRTSQNKVVVFDRGGHGVGDYVRVRITGCTPATLFGEEISEG